MSKQSEKEKNIRKQLHEVLDLVLDINGLQRSCKEDTGDHPTAFIDFVGHVGKINVYLCSVGWSYGTDPDVSFESTIFDDDEFNIPAIIRGLKRFKERGAFNGTG